MDHKKIDFDQELASGLETYNRDLGEWWRSRSNDWAHGHAYRKVIQHIVDFLSVQPRQIIDYACGSGQILTRLAWHFPNSWIIGLDGSPLLLQLAEQRLQHMGKDRMDRVQLVETELPNFSLPKGQSDLLLFIFPNIVPDPANHEVYNQNGFNYDADTDVAHYLAHARESNPEDETVNDDPEDVYDSMITDKVISRNLRGLLRPGGICIRAHYANAPRDKLTELVKKRLAFEEGSLHTVVDGAQADQLFSLLDCKYFRSKVAEDVFHQTGDESDKEGGYLLTTLKAV